MSGTVRFLTTAAANLTLPSLTTAAGTTLFVTFAGSAQPLFVTGAAVLAAPTTLTQGNYHFVGGVTVGRNPGDLVTSGLSAGAYWAASSLTASSAGALTLAPFFHLLPGGSFPDCAAGCTVPGPAWISGAMALTGSIVFVNNSAHFVDAAATVSLTGSASFEMSEGTIAGVISATGTSLVNLTAVELSGTINPAGSAVVQLTDCVVGPAATCTVDGAATASLHGSVDGADAASLLSVQGVSVPSGKRLAVDALRVRLSDVTSADSAAGVEMGPGSLLVTTSAYRAPINLFFNGGNAEAGSILGVATACTFPHSLLNWAVSCVLCVLNATHVCVCVCVCGWCWVCTALVVDTTFSNITFGGDITVPTGIKLTGSAPAAVFGSSLSLLGTGLVSGAVSISAGAVVSASSVALGSGAGALAVSGAGTLQLLNAAVTNSLSFPSFTGVISTCAAARTVCGVCCADGCVLVM